MIDIEVHKISDDGYETHVTYEGWRVAGLSYTGDEPVTFHKHTNTDEVFMLLCGEAQLLTARHGEIPGEVTKTQMKPLHIYNVKKNVWHTEILSKGAKLLIVENSDTDDTNSFEYHPHPPSHTKKS